MTRPISATPLAVGDRVVYTRAHLRSLGAGPTNEACHQVGVVLGFGLTARTWHCNTCGVEVGYLAPINGAGMPTTEDAPECHPGAGTFLRDHGPTDVSRFLRLRWDGWPLETAVAISVVCRQYGLAASEDYPARR